MALSKLFSTLLALAAALAAGCGDKPPAGFQGYVEGEYLAVASPQAGRLARLAVTRGQQVEAGAALFSLETAPEAAQFRQAEQQLRAAEAQLADLKSGKRSPELAVTQAQLAQAQAEQQRAGEQARRDEAQLRVGGISRAQQEQSQAAAKAAAERVNELRSQLSVGALPARTGQMQAQGGQVEAARAALEQAKWRLDQKAMQAPQAGLVSDTLFREGEWVGAGQPVLRLLAPGQVKLRFYVPQPQLSQFQPGRALAVRCDGCPAEIGAKVSFVSPQAEYTPPVIYSNDTRAKLVFMIEATPSPQDARRLLPGQPVEVLLK